ncbi:MAG: VOC family protein [Candidatus Ranarchaeia archaeon]|jgi:predicted enzyme related to lactoylglutathione lyase
MSKKKGRITRVWLSMLNVSNLEDSLKFYQDVLGLPLALDGRKFNHLELGPQEPLAKIGLFETGKKPQEKRSTGIVLDTDDIYAFYERTKKLGVVFTSKPEKQPWGGIAAYFLDPDKNELQVVEDPDHYKRS